MAKPKKRTTHHLSSRYLIVAAVIIVGTGVYYTTEHPFKSKPTASRSSSNTQTARTNSASSDSASVTTLPYQPPVINPSPNVPGGITPDTSSTSLVAPEGTFVSNHGSGTDPAVTLSTEEVSSCTTTPGAACEMEFSNGPITKKLVAQTTSTTSSKSGQVAGTVNWTWTPASIGLTPGNWYITATATLGGQTKSTQDTRQLIVNQ